MFSLSFGPVMVEKGVDVTPYDYPLGEVRDTYARCAIGQLGKLHYLAMTINCQSPDYYVYVTLRQAADSMIAHGCYNAYTLDGGQAGSIIIGNELINPVQFGVERRMSDIFYFATAIPKTEHKKYRSCFSAPVFLCQLLTTFHVLPPVNSVRSSTPSSVILRKTHISRDVAHSA